MTVRGQCGNRNDLCRNSGSTDFRFQHPARVVRQHSDVRIVRSSLWCSEQHKPSRSTSSRMSSGYQLTPNPQLLKFDIDRQIRKIRAETKIRNRATHADQYCTRPSNHSLKLSANGVAHWPSGAGASPHFAPAVQRATPLAPA